MNITVRLKKMSHVRRELAVGSWQLAATVSQLTVAVSELTRSFGCDAERADLEEQCA
jgi:hypothetical protein